MAEDAEKWRPRNMRERLEEIEPASLGAGKQALENGQQQLDGAVAFKRRTSDNFIGSANNNGTNDEPFSGSHGY